MYKQTMLARLMASVLGGAASFGTARPEQQIHHRRARLTSGIGAPVRANGTAYSGGAVSNRHGVKAGKRMAQKRRNVLRAKAQGRG